MEKAKIRHRAKLFLSAVISAAILLLREVTAFADHIAPEPKDVPGHGFLEALPVIALLILGLAILTGVILGIVFWLRKRKTHKEIHEEGASK